MSLGDSSVSWVRPLSHGGDPLYLKYMNTPISVRMVIRLPSHLYQVQFPAAGDRSWGKQVFGFCFVFFCLRAQTSWAKALLPQGSWVLFPITLVYAFSSSSSTISWETVKDTFFFLVAESIWDEKSRGGGDYRVMSLSFRTPCISTG